MAADYSIFAAFLALALGSYLVSIISVRLQGPKAPLVGLKSVFEPRLVANYRFFKDSAAIINDGYARFKGKAFKFVRNDADMVVLPASMVEEIRVLPSSIANPTVAHAHNLLGAYTRMDLILRSNLHFRMIQSKLTPSLGSLTGPMEEEVRFAVASHLPECGDWVAIKPYHMMLELVAHVSARVFVGLPLCRSREWLEISTQFTENIFVSVCYMRLFPVWFHPVLARLLPSMWASNSYIRRAQILLVPEIIRRQRAMASGKLDGTSTNTLLTWMIQSAEGAETDPYHLAHLEVVISLASIHTTQMNAVHVLYDLAAHPEYIAELRDEIIEVAHEGGGWQKASYSKLRKLDSFMKESQRFNPPSMLSYHRVIQQDHFLSDGTYLPSGSHICMPVNAIQNDADVTPDPHVFDALRYYKYRQREGEGHRHQFATTEKNLLNFGHGKYACPGRFFASLEIKVILAPLIMNYDFELTAHQGRPSNLKAHEFLFPNPDGELLIRKRASMTKTPF